MQWIWTLCMLINKHHMDSICTEIAPTQSIQVILGRMKDLSGFWESEFVQKSVWE